MKNKFKGYWSGMPIFKFKLLWQQSVKNGKVLKFNLKKGKWFMERTLAPLINVYLINYAEI